MADRALGPRVRLLMDGVAVLYIAAIAVAAQFSGWYYLLFPELGAISDDVLTRPWGKWARQPGRLLLTPVLGAAVGTLITRELPYHVLTIVLIVVVCLLLLAVLKSNIAPAISAGVLPLVLGAKSWFYPLSIALALVVLFAILLLWRWVYRRKYPGSFDVSAKDVDDVLETQPSTKKWIFPFFVFVTVMGLSATASGLRFILFPPLIVIAYEMFAHPSTCPWARTPVTLPIACCVTSATGLLAVNLFGSGGIAAASAMVCGIAVLRLLRIHMPPALAVGLLPLIINSPDLKYPVSVTIGTVALTLAFLLYRWWNAGQGRAGGDFPKT
jgi:HPP family